MSVSSDFEAIDSDTGGFEFTEMDPQKPDARQDSAHTSVASPSGTNLDSLRDWIDQQGLPMETIDSFLPLLERVPGLQLKDGQYFQCGTLAKEDIQHLSAFTQTIGRFVLTDNGKAGECAIYPGALLRLHYFHALFASGPLFPAIQHLQLNTAGLSLQYLDFFLSSSLKSLEVINIEESHQIPVTVFLSNLLQHGVDLAHISLGPGHITRNLLQTCLEFSNIRELEVTGGLPSMNRTILEELGALPSLQTLILDVGACHYESSEPPNPVNLEAATAGQSSVSIFGAVSQDQWAEPAWEAPGLSRCYSPVCVPRSPCPISPPKEAARTPSPSPSEIVTHFDSRLPEAQVLDSHTGKAACTGASESVGTFPHDDNKPIEFSTNLKKLHIVGEAGLLGDLLLMVTSNAIEDLTVSLVYAKEAPKETPPSPPPMRTIKKASKKKATLPPGPLNDALSFTTSSQPNPVERFLKDLAAAVANWTATLRNVVIGLSSHDSVVELPCAVFETLLSSESLEQFEINGWSLATISETIGCLSSRPPSANLKVLHLPIGNLSSGISLSRLGLIARACPSLLSLRCNLKHISNVPSYPNDEPAEDNLLANSLQILSIGNPSPHPDPERLLLIARYLNALFPKLEKIQTHTSSNETQWAYIGDLIQLHRSMCLDDAARATAV